MFSTVCHKWGHGRDLNWQPSFGQQTHVRNLQPEALSPSLCQDVMSLPSSTSTLEVNPDEANFVTLLVVLTGQQVQTPCSLMTAPNCLVLQETFCTFYISHLLKTSRLHHHHQPIEFQCYAIKSLCDVSQLCSYIMQTNTPERWWATVVCESCHHEVSRDTIGIGQWIQSVLECASRHTALDLPLQVAKSVLQNEIR